MTETAVAETAVTKVAMAPEDIAVMRQVHDPQVSPDGTSIAFVVSDPDLEDNRYRRQLWLAATDSGASAAHPFSGGGREQLPRWSPDSSRLAFVAKEVDGSAVICTLPVSTGGERVSVAVVDPSVSELAWSPDGTQLAFVAADPDLDQYGPLGKEIKPRDMPPRRVSQLRYRLNGAGWTMDRPTRVFVVGADGAHRPRALTSGPWGASDLAWSPDGSRIAFASSRHENWDLDLCVDLWVVGTQPGSEPKRLTDTTSDFSSPSWSLDGTRLAYHRTPTPLSLPRHVQVGVVEYPSGQYRDLTAGLDRNCTPIRSPAWIGDRIMFSAEQHGNVHLYQVAADGASDPEVLVAGERSVTGWDWTAGTLALASKSPTTLPELSVLAAPALAEASRFDAAPAERIVTAFTSALAARVEICVPQRFTARSPDGSSVECWVIAPAGAASGSRYPTLLNVHGGPFTQYGSQFFDEFQLQAGAGFGVLYCNPRGSSGYSEQWGRAVRWPECTDDPGSGWGGVDYEDVLACVEEACRRFDWIDAGRLGILGGSYGGYMTSWAAAHGGPFKAACSERACNNLLTMEHNSDIAGFMCSYVGRTHLEDPAAYLRQSPVTYARDIAIPMLLIHSEDDLRCPINQAEELFVALRMLGRDVEFVRFPDESHELSRSGFPRHRVARAHLIIDWFRRHLEA